MAALHRRSRTEQREGFSPEVSLKQQRINTAKKARAIAHLSTTPNSSSPSDLDVASLTPQEKVLYDNACTALSSTSLDEYLHREQQNSVSYSLVTSCNPFDMHFMQATSLLVDLPPALPDDPTRKDFATLPFLYKYAALVFSQTSSLTTPININNINVPLYENDPNIRSSVEYNATTMFDKFAATHSLIEPNMSKNGVSSMTQIELAVLLMYLSKAANPSEYLIGKALRSGIKEVSGCKPYNNNVIDTLVNSLLSTVSNKKKNPKELSMAVACLAYTVQYHSMSSRVLTASNASQLVKLLLSKCVYPTEVSK